MRLTKLGTVLSAAVLTAALLAAGPARAEGLSDKPGQSIEPIQQPNASPTAPNASTARTGPAAQRTPDAKARRAPDAQVNVSSRARADTDTTGTRVNNTATFGETRNAQFSRDNWNNSWNQPRDTSWNQTRDTSWNTATWRDSRRLRHGPGLGIAFGAYPYRDNGSYVYGDRYAYDDGYSNDAYAAAPDDQIGPGGDAGYCMQRFKSYDAASGTYLGYDGARHPCP